MSQGGPNSLPDPTPRRPYKAKALTPIPRPPVDAAPEPPPPPYEEEAYTPPPEEVAPPISGQQAVQARRVLLELARRRIEGLSLYEPLPAQEEFHRSRARERVLRGSNRGGKTLPAAVEVARAVTGQDPYNKYPKKDGRWFCVGKDGKHLSAVMWRKLGRPGAYKIIRDQDTGEWRAFRPHDPADACREESARPAPPLIPPRMIKEIGWENKKEGQPNVVRLHNGWEICFFSSLGKPPQGSDIDGAWFDEEIVDPEWYPEMSARLLDRKGRFVWSATPQAGTEQLYNLHEESERLRDAGSRRPRVQEFVILLENNPHITEEQKREFAAKLSDEERLVRVGGEFVFLSFKVYPEFTPLTFLVDHFQVPATWTRYVSVDPGRQVCAALFAAVPPPDVGGAVYFYDELYLQGCDAEQFGQAMARKCQGQHVYAFIIDHQAGRQHEIASGKTVEEQYSDALRRNKTSCQLSGVNFTWGAADVEGGTEAFRSWLRVGHDGAPRLRVLRDACPNFLHEIKYYRYKRVAGVITDRPEDRGRVHQMANARYLAMFGLRHVQATAAALRKTGALGALKAKQARKKDHDGQRVISLGPRSR